MSEYLFDGEIEMDISKISKIFTVNKLYKENAEQRLYGGGVS